eukprot:166076-Rhodomonas_salina.3
MSRNLNHEVEGFNRSFQKTARQERCLLVLSPLKVTYKCESHKRHKPQTYLPMHLGLDPAFLLREIHCNVMAK